LGNGYFGLEPVADVISQITEKRPSVTLDLDLGGNQSAFASDATPDSRMHSLLILLGRQGSRIFWRTEERWKWHSGSLAMPTAGQ
jgi:hypothetical protein